MKRELQTTGEYFPYIGHQINHQRQYQEWIYRGSVGSPFYRKETTWHKDGDQAMIKGDPGELFHTVEVNGLLKHKALAADPNSVEVIAPRHRTLYDYTIGQPVHHDLVNPEVLLLAGNNLFVFPFNEALRVFGAFMFLRSDVILKRRGLPPAYLTQERYINDVFPAYLREEMILGKQVNGKLVRRDFLMYPEQEKDPFTKKRGGGRTKTGKLRSLSHILFDKLKGISKDSGVTVYITPVNVSLSKVPEAPYIVYPVRKKGLAKNLGYLREQCFVYFRYPHFCRKHPEARLDIVVNYGEPVPIDHSSFQSMRDLLKFSKEIQHRIGRLETIFPTPFLFRVMDEDAELSLSSFRERAARLYAYYRELGINLEPVSDKKGQMLPATEIIERSLLSLNANPPFHLKQRRSPKLLQYTENTLKSLDFKVHTWYANNIRHLDEK